MNSLEKVSVGKGIGFGSMDRTERPEVAISERGTQNRDRKPEGSGQRSQDNQLAEENETKQNWVRTSVLHPKQISG